jgi:hypothetical protein
MDRRAGKEGAVVTPPSHREGWSRRCVGRFVDETSVETGQIANCLLVSVFTLLYTLRASILCAYPEGVQGISCSSELGCVVLYPTSTRLENGKGDGTKMSQPHQDGTLDTVS